MYTNQLVYKSEITSENNVSLFTGESIANTHINKTVQKILYNNKLNLRNMLNNRDIFNKIIKNNSQDTTIMFKQYKL